MGGQMKSVTGVTYLNCPLFMNNSIKHTSQTYPQILKDLKKKTTFSSQNKNTL